MSIFRCLDDRFPARPFRRSFSAPPSFYLAIHACGSLKSSVEGLEGDSHNCHRRLGKTNKMGLDALCKGVAVFKVLGVPTLFHRGLRHDAQSKDPKLEPCGYPLTAKTTYKT